jgi:short subunit dehydrogenase-like uncharacterized protein
MERSHDVVLLGATGFTGSLTAAELALRAPEGLRLALAGRNRDKLARVVERLAPKAPRLADAELLHADVTDPGSLRELAESTRVLVTTVGPYALHGEPVVAACAAAGTDYVDLTGEPEFIDRMYLAHHRKAVQTGARLVHACGFDSIPHDLGAQFTVEQLPEGVPLHVRGYVRAGGLISGGTWASALTGFSRARQTIASHRARRAAEPQPEGRRIRLEARPHRALGWWAVPLPTIDPMVIGRSAAALDRYGPDFTYGHYAGAKRLPVAVGGVLGVTGAFVAAQVGPVRRFLLSRWPQGKGPSEQQMDRGWFKVTFVGEGGGRRVVCEVLGGDPGYRETSRMLAESALCLAVDELPETAGQVTTAAAMGAKLRERLQRSGIEFRVVESSGA